MSLPQLVTPHPSKTEGKQFPVDARNGTGWDVTDELWQAVRKSRPVVAAWSMPPRQVQPV